MVNPDSGFWRDRTVFLTGHTGFKGAWLSLWLQRLGAHVIGYALGPPSQPALFEVAGGDTVSQHICADIRDRAALTAAIREARPSIVLHLAAQSLVRASYDDPVETYSTNVMGTLNLLEAVRATGGVAAVINVTSDKCYENRNWHWAYRENEPMGGFDPYSSSKGCAELLTSAYRGSYFSESDSAPALASARAGNVIGGGDWAADRIIPDSIRAFETGQPLKVRNPLATRPWQHVLEPLSGYLLLAERLGQGDGRMDFAEAWNFGPSDNGVLTVGELMTRATALWGPEASWAPDKTVQPHEDTLLKVDAAKARARLQWRNRLGVDDALAWTIDWHRQWRAGECARALCLDQIQRYESISP